MISIDPAGGKPLYEQVVEGFRDLIAAGVMASGEKLPSVRSLATQLAINPNTIQRAYRELESLGYTYSAPGRGSFVAKADQVADVRREELLGEFDGAVERLLAIGVTPEELAARLPGVSGRDPKGTGHSGSRPEGDGAFRVGTADGAALDMADAHGGERGESS